MFITGVINNPLMLLSRQRGYSLRTVKEDKCELILERCGLVADLATDKRVEAQFNGALDRLAEWRTKDTAGTSRTDDSLESNPLLSSSLILPLYLPSFVYHAHYI